MNNSNNNFARSIWDIDPVNKMNKLNDNYIEINNLISNKGINDPLLSNFFKSQMIAKGNASNRSSMFNIDGFLDKVEEEKRRLIELIDLNFNKIPKETKKNDKQGEYIQIVQLEKEDDEDDPCCIYICPICSTFKNVYPKQCSQCERIYCIECSKNMKVKAQGCSCGLKPYSEKDIGPTTRQTIDKFKIRCPNLTNQCSKILNFERLNYHLSQDCLNIDYSYVCKYCGLKTETNFWKIEILRDHLLTKCPEIKIKCEYCEKEVERKLLIEHTEICDLRIIKCEDCENNFTYIEYKNNHTKKVCIDNIKDTFLKEMKNLKEENSILANENNLIKKNFENQNLEMKNLLCEKEDLQNKNIKICKESDERKERYTKAKAEYENSIKLLEDNLNEQRENTKSYINQMNSIKEEYDKNCECNLNQLKEEFDSKIISLLAEKKKIENESNDLMSLIKKLEALNKNKKEIHTIDIANNTIFYKNGSKYIGDIKDNKENGKGSFYELKYNMVYEGEFLEGKKSGKGSQYNALFIYCGSFYNDKRNGEGIFFRINDINKIEKFIGSWKDDKKDGIGKQYDDNKLIYEGNFSKDKYNGDGTLYHENGYYEGKILENQKHGKGIFYFTEGCYSNVKYRYEGSWKDNEKYGEYKIYDKFNKLIEEGFKDKKK